MGLAETLLALGQTSGLEQRAMQVLPWGDWGTSGTTTASGVSVSQDNALQLLTVYGCVSLISDTIATLPRDVYRTVGKENQEVPVRPRWLEQPNARTDIIEFLTQSLSSLLLDGNAYWVYRVDLNFQPTELTVLDPTKVQIKANGDILEYWVDGQRFTGRLLHIKGLTRPGCIKGLSPIESARQSIGLGLGAQEFAGSFYRNGTTLSGVITVPGDLTQDQAKQLKEGWARDNGGLSKAHMPGVITNGATWTQIAVTPEQAQFLETREYQAAEIAAQLFLLDPSMLGIAINRGQNLTYANLEQRGIHLVQFTLMRWIIRLERAFSFLLPKPQFFKFNVDALQRADMKTRYESYRIGLGPTQPFLVVNEPRSLEDLPPMSGFDKFPEPVAPPVPPADQPPGVPA